MNGSLRQFAPRGAFALAMILGVLGLASFATPVAAETIPAKPAQPVVDAAGVIPADREAALNRRLADFERETSNQIMVALYPRMDSKSSIEDYTVRVSQAWKVGQKDRDNGAVLFVFIEDRSMYIQVGYGLEGALPDALAHRIIEDHLKPAFRRGDFAGGVESAVSAMIAATKGEYKGTGLRAGESHAREDGPAGLVFFIFVLLMVLGGAFGGGQRRRGVFYTGMGHRRSGGGFGGGGGFSGGGGRFGGGGAGGRW